MTDDLFDIGTCDECGDPYMQDMLRTCHECGCRFCEHCDPVTDDKCFHCTEEGDA